MSEEMKPETSCSEFEADEIKQNSDGLERANRNSESINVCETPHLPLAEGDDVKSDLEPKDPSNLSSQGAETSYELETEQMPVENHQASTSGNRPRTSVRKERVENLLKERDAIKEEIKRKRQIVNEIDEEIKSLRAGKRFRLDKRTKK